MNKKRKTITTTILTLALIFSSSIWTIFASESPTPTEPNNIRALNDANDEMTEEVQSANLSSTLNGTLNVHLYDDAIANVFQGGKVFASYKDTEQRNLDKENEMTETYSKLLSEMQKGKDYNCYLFNPDDNSYIYVQTVNDTQYPESYLGYIMFFVESEHDQNITVRERYDGYKMGFYNELSDPTLNSLVKSYVNFKQDIINISNNSFTVSKDTINYIRSSPNRFMFKYSINEYKIPYTQNAYISSLIDSDVNLSFPTYNEIDSIEKPDILKSFPYGTPAKYISCKSQDESKLTFYNISDKKFSNITRYNLYIYDEELNDFGLVSTNITDSSLYGYIAHTTEYFAVPVLEDSYVKNAEHSILTDINKDAIRRCIRVSQKYDSSNYTLTTDHDTMLTPDVLKELKELGGYIEIRSVKVSPSSSHEIDHLGTYYVNGNLLTDTSKTVILSGSPISTTTQNERIINSFKKYGNIIAIFNVDLNGISGIQREISLSDLKTEYPLDKIYNVIKYNEQDSSFSTVAKNVKIRKSSGFEVFDVSDGIYIVVDSNTALTNFTQEYNAPDAPLTTDSNKVLDSKPQKSTVSVATGDSATPHMFVILGIISTTMLGICVIKRKIAIKLI